MLRPRIFVLFILALLPIAEAATSDPIVVGRNATDFSFQTTEGSKRIRDFRSKWLLLQFGASWCRPSECTAAVFSGIQRRLEGQPFVFLELNSDPTLSDVDLYSQVRFAGLRGLIPQSVPRPFNASSFPRWYLIDPRGVIRAAGATEAPDKLQEDISRVIAGPLKLKSEALEPLPDDKSLAEADFLYLQQDYAAARETYFAIFQKDPKAIDALLKAGMAEAYVHNLSAGRKFVDKNMPADAALTDRQIVYQTNFITSTPKKFELVERLGPVFDRHPDSQYLKSTLLVEQKLPEEATDDDLNQIFGTLQGIDDLESRAFLAVALESRAKIAPALKYGEPNLRRLTNYRIAHMIGLLTRHGQQAKARSIYFKDWPIERAATANAQEAWEYAFIYATLSDWDAADAYGARYQQLIGNRPFGMEMQWLAAIRERNFTGADALAKQVQAFAETHPQYKVAAAAFQGTALPPRESLINGFDTHTRRDNILAYALIAERSGNFEAARKAYRTMRELDDTVSFPNALATHLSLTLGK
jgi:thiol-disulfide isomerase/thioredoxin